MVGARAGAQRAMRRAVQRMFCSSLVLGALLTGVVVHGLWSDRSEKIAENRRLCRGGSAVLDSNADNIFEVFFAGAVSWVGREAACELGGVRVKNPRAVIPWGAPLHVWAGFSPRVAT